MLCPVTTKQILQGIQWCSKYLFWKLLNVCGLVLHVKIKQNKRKPSEEKMLHGVQMRHSPVRERRNPTVIELCGVKWESFLSGSESDPMAYENVLW